MINFPFSGRWFRYHCIRIGCRFQTRFEKHSYWFASMNLVIRICEFVLIFPFTSTIGYTECQQGDKQLTRYVFRLFVWLFLKIFTIVVSEQNSYNYSLVKHLLYFETRLLINIAYRLYVYTYAANLSFHLLCFNLINTLYTNTKY